MRDFFYFITRTHYIMHKHVSECGEERYEIKNFFFLGIINQTFPIEKFFNK